MSGKDEYIMEKFYLIAVLLISIPAIADSLDDGVAFYFDEGDSKKATEIIQPLADKGNADAQYYIGLIKYDNENYKAAFDWFMKSAQQDFSDGQMSLASMYKNGEAVKRNGKKAIEWYKKVADKGSTDSETEIADIYAKGIDVEVDVKKAIEWYVKAAEKDNSYAQYSLGEIYAKGEMVKQDGKKAIKWYTKAANTGDPLPLFGLAELYCNGKGVNKNLKKCAHWAKKAKVADFDVTELWNKFELEKYE